MYNVTVCTAFAGNIELRSYVTHLLLLPSKKKYVVRKTYIIVEELVYHQCSCLDQIRTESLAVPLHLQSDFENPTVKQG